ncbi:hypothetical protein [Kitasatospora sp. NPDC051705]|uniref:hypothetical protein n=1 Tax=Kitasatospora sp. NPDC051705 TaxID=3364057 RepID=UPI0037A159B8
MHADVDELVVVVDLARLPHRPEWLQGPAGLTEVARHRLSLADKPLIRPEHYRDHPQDRPARPLPPS